MTNKEQMEFEKWAKEEGFNINHGVINGYDFESTARAWATWQARAALDKQDIYKEALNRIYQGITYGGFNFDYSDIRKIILDALGNK